jgi:hypothetical protein
MIVADLAPDHSTCGNCRHHPHFGTFPSNAKRRRKGVTTVTNVIKLQR